jgi:hypothetical protein
MINPLPYSDVRFIPWPEKEVVRDLKGEMLKVLRELLKLSGGCNDPAEHHNERASGNRIARHHTVATVRSFNYLEGTVNPVRTARRPGLFVRVVSVRHTMVTVANNLRHCNHKDPTHLSLHVGLNNKPKRRKSKGDNAKYRYTIRDLPNSLVPQRDRVSLISLRNIWLSVHQGRPIQIIEGY